MKSEEDINKKLIGYYGTYRGKFLLLKNGVLSKEEFLLYDVSIALADWDKKNHPKTYGSFYLVQSDVEDFCGWKAGYVSRHSKNLYKKGLWEKRRDGRIQVIGFELTETKLLGILTKKYKVVNLQEFIARLQNDIANTQEKFVNSHDDVSKDKRVNYDQNIANMQSSSSKSDIVSSKDQYNKLESKNTSIVNINENAQLTEDDKEWITEDLNKNENY